MVDAQLVEGVARLVQGAEERAGQILLVDAGGDAHVVVAELRHVRMIGLVLPPPRKVVAELLDHGDAERPLLGFRIVAAQEGIFHGGLPCDRLGQGRQLHAQLLEDPADHLGAHPLVVPVDQRIHDVAIAGEIIGQLPAHVECSFEIGAHGGEVVLGRGLRPHHVGRRRMLGQGAGKVGGDAHAALVVAAGHPQQGCVVAGGRQAFRIRLQLVQQPPDGRVGILLVCDLLQHRQLACPIVAPAHRHVGRLIPRQDGAGVADVRRLTQARHQLLFLLF